MNFNPYLVFDVPMSADFELLRATYRRLARENHPDIASDKPAATERMAQINLAWSILGDQAKRARFDAEFRLHNSDFARREAGRREMNQREIARREAAVREVARSRRAPSAARPKSTQSAPRGARPAAPRSDASGAKTPSSTSKPAAKKAKRGLGVRLRAKIVGNAKVIAPAPPGARPATVRATFDEAASPRALRLMRKVTLASRLWHRDGNAKVAIDMCRAVLLHDGRNVPARELLSEIFASQGRLEIAVMMLDQAIQIAPDDLFLRRKRDHIERARFPDGQPRPLRRPSLWQRFRAKFQRRR